MIIYKLLNKLFGWDYIAWQNPADSGIARVHVDGMHRVWYWRYKTTRVADIIKAPQQVVWLTCSSTKYFPPSVKYFPTSDLYVNHSTPQYDWDDGFFCGVEVGTWMILIILAVLYEVLQ